MTLPVDYYIKNIPPPPVKKRRPIIMPAENPAKATANPENMSPGDYYVSQIPVAPPTATIEIPPSPPVENPAKATARPGKMTPGEYYISQVPVVPPPEKLDDTVRGMIEEMMALPDAGEEALITSEEAAERGIVMPEGYKVRGYGENGVTMFSIIDDLGYEYRLDGTVRGPDGEEIEYGEEEEPGLTEIKDDLQVLFPGSSEESISYLVENLENTWFQDVVIRQIKKAGRNEMTENLLRAMGADEGGISEFFSLLEVTKPEPVITNPEQDISAVSDTVTAGMTVPFFNIDEFEGAGQRLEPKQMSLDEYISMRITEDQIPISNIDFSSPENAMLHSPAMRKGSPGMEEEYQKWVRQTDAIAKYTKEYRQQVGEGTFTQQVGATIIGQNPVFPMPMVEKIIQPGGSWEKAKNASVEEKIVTALTIAGISAWALGKPLSILFGNTRGALQEAKLAAEFKNTQFYKDLSSELRGTVIERDIYNVYKIYRSGIKGATVEESDKIAEQMMARIYNDIKAGRYDDFAFKTPQKPPTEPAATPHLGPGGENIETVPGTSPKLQSEITLDLRNQIHELFKLAFRDKSIKKAVEVGEPNTDIIEHIKLENGIDIQGYKFSINTDFIRHAQGGHSKFEMEDPRGQVALTEDDYQLIPEIVKNPDSIKPGEKNQGLDTIWFIKRVDGTIYYLQAVQTGKKRLAGVTMRKYKSKRKK